MTRSSRSINDASRKHQLSLHTTLPTKNVALNVVHNKVQLINVICHRLINPNTTPVQVWMEQVQSPKRRYENKPRRSRCNHCTSEASDDSYTKVVCSNTDVFVLLIHFYFEKNMTMNVSMESPCAGRTIISTKHHWYTSISPNICLPFTPRQGVIRHHIGVALERPQPLRY